MELVGPRERDDGCRFNGNKIVGYWEADNETLGGDLSVRCSARRRLGIWAMPKVDVAP